MTSVLQIVSQVATLGYNNLPQIAAMSPPQDKIATKLGELDTIIGERRSIFGLETGITDGPLHRGPHEKMWDSMTVL